MVLKERKTETRSTLKRVNPFLRLPLGMVAIVAWLFASSHPFQNNANAFGPGILLLGAVMTWALALLGKKRVAVVTIIIAALGFILLFATAMYYRIQALTDVAETYSAQYHVPQGEISVGELLKEDEKSLGLYDQCKQKNVSCYAVTIGKDENEGTTRYVLAHTSLDKVESLEVISEQTKKVVNY